MPIKFRFQNLDKGAWVLLRQAYNLILKCEDQVFSEYELTTEQHTVLMAIENIKGPVRITDIARWLDRTANSISMIVDRMVNAGLVKRTRDRKDRRTVFVSMTSKAEKVYTPATAAGWALVREILSPLSDHDKRTLIKLLETLRDKTYGYLESEEVAEEVRRSETEMTQFRREVAKSKRLSGPQSKRQAANKEGTIR
jgi:DNA-binding MarR family transcriptional regulator